MKDQVEDRSRVLQSAIENKLRDKDVRAIAAEALKTSDDRLTQVLADLESKHALKHDDVRSNDEIRDAVDALLDQPGQVGTKPTEEVMKQRIADARKRYDANVPTPGSKDQKKDNPYGDYLIWCELVDKARDAGTPILFVSRDQKDDWYRRHNGKLLGPLPGLRAEMKNGAQQLYHHTTLDGLLHLAKAHLGLNVEDEDVASVAAATSVGFRKAVDLDDEESPGDVWRTWFSGRIKNTRPRAYLRHLLDVIEQGEVVDSRQLDAALAADPSTSPVDLDLINRVASGKSVDTETLGYIVSQLGLSDREMILRAARNSSPMTDAMFDRIELSCRRHDIERHTLDQNTCPWP